MKDLVDLTEDEMLDLNQRIFWYFAFGLGFILPVSVSLFLGYHPSLFVLGIFGFFMGMILSIIPCATIEMSWRRHRSRMELIALRLKL